MSRPEMDENKAKRLVKHPQYDKVLRMNAAGHPPGVIAQYTGMSRGDVVFLLEEICG